jgi:hypothetical protein
MQFGDFYEFVDFRYQFAASATENPFSSKRSAAQNRKSGSIRCLPSIAATASLAIRYFHPGDLLQGQCGDLGSTFQAACHFCMAS